MEFLLPLALKFFPNMLPSTFQDKLKKEENDKTKLLKDYPFIADEMLAMSG